MGIFDIFNAGKYKQQLEEMNRTFDELQIHDVVQAKQKLKELQDATNTLQNKKAELQTSVTTLQELKELQDAINTLQNKKAELQTSITTLQETETSINKKVKTATNKLNRSKELYKSINYAVENFLKYDNADVNFLNAKELAELEEYCPSIYLKLHCMDVKDLRKAYRENEKAIDTVLESYSTRYTTKANKSIYNLMVLALRAELQNILYNLKYEKLDSSIELIKCITGKYLKICAEGNQTIAPTLTKFIGEIEYLFINSIKIEHNYYIRKEQARQEQLAIRQQMREEAEERRQLEQQKKQIEKEESKYEAELIKLKEMLSEANEAKTLELNARILELERQLADVQIKKDEITQLQNGKAGNVYIISNLGSFGENIFKIGMTRRLDPNERVHELGSASVPFKFDIHSMIFSDDAVSLEKQLHEMLHEKRVNKVNLRKEFFNVSLDELEKLVTDLQPTAEFNRTMLAEEFRQSVSSDVIYDYAESLYDDDEDEE